MSLLPNQTNISQTDYFFLLANISSLNANNISTGTLTALFASISSLNTNTMSTGVGFISTISTTLIDIDGQALTATPTELLLNGIPLATTSNLSSIADWSLDPAISTVYMNGNDLDSVKNISTLSIQSGNGYFYNLIAFNSLFVSTATSTISSAIMSADLAIISSFENEFGSISSFTVSSINGIDANVFGLQSTISTFETASISSFSVSSINGIDANVFGLQSTISTFETASVSSFGVSSINGQPISFYEPGSVSTISSFQQLGTSSLTVSTVNGIVPDSVGNWANYGAVNQVNLQNNRIYSGSASTDDVNIVAERFVKATGEYVYVNADNGISIINPSLVQISTTNGLRGQIDLIANDGLVLGGKITLTANGADLGGLLYGGVIEITANTGGGFIPTPAFTSAVRVNAASILEYSGATNSIGSVAGYGFYHGDAGLNLTAGVPPLVPNDPLTVYLNGTNGVLVYSALYVNGPIRPYSDLTQNPVDLYIEAYNNFITTGYIQLRGVSTATFAGGDTAILGLNRLQFSTIAGAIENVSSINGQPITFYEPGGVSTLSSFTELFTSSFVASTIQTEKLNTFTLDNVSSINGISIGELINVSSISSLNEWSYFPAISSINADGYDIIKVNAIEALPGGGLDIVADSGVVIRTVSGAQASLVAGPTTLSSLNIANKIDFDVSTPSTLTLKVHNGVDQANLAVISISAPYVSTGFIQGTATDLFGISGFNDGLIIRASTIAITSTPSIVFTGNLNASTCSFFQGNIRDVVASTITTSTLSVASAFAVPSISTGSITATGATISSLAFSQAGAFGLSSLMYLSTQMIPLSGGATSTCLYTNTDFSVGQGDLFCQQLRVGYGNTSQVNSEIVIYAVDNSVKSLSGNSGDTTLRIAPNFNSVVSNGYLLDTRLNPPFISTLNNQSTALMAFFPSSIQSTIGASTIALFPAPLPLQQFGVSTFQATAFNISLPRNYTATNYGIQITPMANTILPVHASTVSVSSFQAYAGGGASIGTAFFWQTIGMNY